MIRLKFAAWAVQSAHDSWVRAVKKHPCGPVSDLHITPSGGREYTIQLPTIH